MVRRIGLTMRVDNRSGEFRNCLAQDWSRLLCKIPRIQWIQIPNLEKESPDYLSAWQVDRVILTGGEDTGTSPLRDSTEKFILEHCLENNLPVLGVCRGMQFIQLFFGGQLTASNEIHYSGQNHELFAENTLGECLLGSSKTQVNSYHNYGIADEGLSPDLESWAVSSDGLVEICHQRVKKILAVQWHPERSLPDPGLAHRILEAFRDE